MALKRLSFRCLLALGALSSALIFFPAPLLADDEASPSASAVPSVTACNDENVRRMFNETTAFYRRVSGERAKRAKSANKKPTKTKSRVSPEALYYDKEVDHLWSRLPDCSTPDKRGDLSHHAFKQYMNAMLVEAYESAFLKMDAENLHDARFYVNCYLAVENGLHGEAKADGWTSWLAFESQSLPSIQALDKQLYKAGF
jgi:hypothetical protein